MYIKNLKINVLKKRGGSGGGGGGGKDRKIKK